MLGKDGRSHGAMDNQRRSSFVSSACGINAGMVCECLVTSRAPHRPRVLLQRGASRGEGTSIRFFPNNLPLHLELCNTRS
jgi:hypothetical protein